MAPPRRSSRRQQQQNIVPTSDSGEDLLMSSSPVSKSTFKGVYIPNSSSVPNSESGSALSPAFSKSNSPAIYDTPATSVVVTPAQSVASKTRRGRSRVSSVKATLMGQVQNVDDTSEDGQFALSLQVQEYEDNTPAKSTGRSRAAKGKGRAKEPETEISETIVVRSRPSRGAKKPDTPVTSPDEDAQLAIRLQEEEYEKDENLVKRGKRAGKKSAFIKDSSDESDSSLSSAQSADEFEEEDVIEIDDSDDSDAEPLSLKRKRAQTITSRRNKRLKGTKQTARRQAEPEMEQEADEGEDDDEWAEPTEDDEEEDAESSLEVALSGESGSEAAAPGTVAALTAAERRNQRRRLTRSQRRDNTSRPARNREARARIKLEAAHPEIKTMWDDLSEMSKVPTEQAEQPVDISRKLKGFQLEGLNWMCKQEKTSWRGGLLGDEMGMGKTIQAVSLIMSDYPARSPTIVVVPPVALMQWTNEINDYTNGKLKVLIYHGTNTKAKHMSVNELKSHNVILISYSSLESIYRKETKGWTRGQNLIKEDSAIHAIYYHRIILDEAHSIKGRTTGVAKACCALEGDYRWCLSGTPVQNRIGEFFSLLRFLQASPYANYFCKQCSCSSLHWSMDKFYRCTQCKHRALDHVSVFNQEILNPITGDGRQEGERVVATKEAFRKLRLITDRIMLRRIKNDQTASMELPPKEVFIHNEFFGEIEQDFAASIMGSNTRKFDTYVSHGVMLDNYANIFGLIMQMRQVADHPDLILKKNAPESDRNVLVCQICDEPAEDAIRSRCRHEFCRECARDYVKNCEGNEITADCPRCHIALAIDLDQPEIEQDEEQVKKSSIINRIKMENWTSSTKIEMLVYDLWKMRSKKETTKSIVFSQFTSMLQLIEWRLRRAGFNTVMLDGSMSPAQRQKSIEHFMNNTDVEVFLVSLKAGGVALNLTEASRVFIVDPWWNPAAEWQSADRCHRIGQKRPCVITRLCVEDSIESRIVMLQEKKAHMINGTVNNDDVAMEKLTPQDMSFLFRGS